jgi:hypothetical protein
MMARKKNVTARILVRLFFLISLATFAWFGTSFALGDLGLVVEKIEDSGRVEQCKYCGRFIKPGSIHRDADVLLGNQIRERLTEKGVGFQEGKKKAGFLHVLVYRFQERKGGNYAVDKPASVGFHLHLMEDSSVRRVFVFDESQQSLSQNVFDIGKFFQRGGKWVTAEELSREGIKAGLEYLLEGME